jgi:CMP/dCMP kinase
MSSDSARADGRRGLRVAISGKSGCGNTTVSRLVAAALGLQVVNYTFKNIAQERNMSFEQVCLLAETDPQYDLAVDRRQVQLADGGGCVLGSRLAIWLLKDSAFTVYLEAPLPVRAGRIALREGKPREEALRETDERDRRDHDRYARLYGYNVDSYGFAALVVDAEHNDQESVARQIVERARRFHDAP